MGIQRDKWIHFIVSYILIIVVFMVLRQIQFLRERYEALIFVLAFTVAFFVGLLKETADAILKESGTPDSLDILADFLGAGAGLMTLIIIAVVQKSRQQRLDNETSNPSEEVIEEEELNNHNDQV